MLRLTDRWALLVDAVAVVAFVLIGRASHDEDQALTGFLRTLWPFAVGLGIGWFVLVRPDRARDLPAARPSAGLVTGVHTAVVGLALRGITGQGIALSFLIVAVVVLTVFMTGWRGIWWLLRRGGAPGHAAAVEDSEDGL